MAKLRGYVVALLSTGVALAAAFELTPIFNDAPVPLMMAAVTVSAWSGGLGPGLLATLVAAIALDRAFDLARNSPLGLEDTVFDLALFVAVALLISALNARLRLLNQRIEAARSEAEAALRARDQLLGIVAHDLKSPLAGISLSAQLIQRRLARMAPDAHAKVRDSLLDIEGGAEHMVNLIDDLLDVTHLRAGGVLQLRREPARLRDVVDQAVRRQRAASERHAIHVVADADPSGVWDAARLGRVLDNLLSNAIKYSPRGGDVSIELSRDAAAPGESWAVVRIRDHGIGIPSQDLERVFEGFFRGGNVGQIAGTGLGLAGARAIVEQHGGRLRVESREGCGTTVTLQLPAPE